MVRWTTLAAVVLTATTLSLLLLVAWGLDGWLGVLAFLPQYAAACALVAGVIGAAWMLRSRRSAVAVGSVAFALLMSLYVVNEPSSRILRGVLLDVETGTPSEDVEGMVVRAYAGSGYALPLISVDDDRLHVSLMTQQPGDCTAAVFHIDRGVVVRSEFSAD